MGPSSSRPRIFSLAALMKMPRRQHRRRLLQDSDASCPPDRCPLRRQWSGSTLRAMSSRPCCSRCSLRRTQRRSGNSTGSFPCWCTLTRTPTQMPMLPSRRSLEPCRSCPILWNSVLLCAEQGKRLLGRAATWMLATAGGSRPQWMRWKRHSVIWSQSTRRWVSLILTSAASLDRLASTRTIFGRPQSWGETSWKRIWLFSSTRATRPTLM
mmetsp:Transcript_114499/g.334756  ORF Transcript_114499/g.334756 Transcript_114499/m.334756 type:complete len:211 (+) Transcript_114499:390-1022(+)